MVMNKYNNKKKYRGFDTQNRKIVIASDEPAVDENGKQKSHLVTPKPKNTETLVAQPPTPGFDSVKIHHELQPHGALARMQEKGLKITSYTETDGAGRPITNRRYDDDYE
jgi:hypothetical protein